MENEPKRLSAPASEQIRLDAPIGRGARGFLVFLICCAVLVAAFAVSRIWAGRRPNEERRTDTGEEAQAGDTTVPQADGRDTTPDDPLPDGAVAIRAADLSGKGIRNETAYRIDPDAMRTELEVGSAAYSPDEPIVLILHTHAQEGYRPDGTPYLTGSVGDAIYTDDPSAGVVAAGDALRQALVRGGVPTIHCTDVHGKNGTLRGSYASAADCIRAYLKQYPSIQYVIDLHRDGILASDGACVRTLSEGGSAQIMAVVGSDGGGESCPAWRENLSLALLLSERLNTASEGISRPVSLRNATYNQELAPHSLLLEIGSAGNTVEEAKSAAALAGEVLADLLCGRSAGR